MRAFRLSALATVLLFGAGFLLFVTAGGTARYVKTYGDSMEPSFRAGDLAVVAPSPSYEIGDVVAYRSPELDRVVLHRLVDRQGETLTFQGDNNEFPDRERLIEADILGSVTLRVPRGGAFLSWLQSPLHAVALAVLLTLLPAYLRRRNRPDQSASIPTRGTPMKPLNALPLTRALPWLAAGAAASILAGALVVAFPATATISRPGTLTHTGSFGYSSASTSALYPTGFTTGDPIFTRLSDQVSVEFTHRTEDSGEFEGDGTIRVDASLTGPGGWRRTVPLVATRPLDAKATTVRAELRLRDLQALGDEAAAITGTLGGELRIAVNPVIELRGTAGGHRIEDQFAPTLNFALDAAALRLAPPADGQSGGLVQTREVATGGSSLPAMSPFGMLAGAIPAASAPALLAGGLLMALGALYGLQQSRGAAGPGPVSRRYAHLLVPIRGVDRGARRPLVEVSTMADLVRLAKHHGELVLHEVDEGRHRYLLELRGTAYVYRPPLSALPSPDGH